MKLTNYLLVLMIYFLFFNICNAQWAQMSNGMNGGLVYSLANSGNNIFAGTAGGVYISSNSGLSWANTTLYQSVSSLAISGNYIFAGTHGYGVYLSSNNGISWTQRGLNNQLVYSLAISGNNIFAGTNVQGVYLSTNNGTSWTQIGLNGKDIYSLCISDSNIFAGTFYYGVYHSTNNGTNWSQTTLINSSIPSLAISGSNILAGAGLGVYRSTNNGVNWILTALNQTVLSFGVSGSTVLAGTYGDGVYLSSNSGYNWMQWNYGFNTLPDVYSAAISNDYFFAGTFGQSVWRRPLSQMGITNISSDIPNSFSLYQNYPNPFNPVTKIEIDISKTGYVKLLVYDILGREVAILVNEQLQPGTYEADWDASNYTSGVYFYTLQTESFSETKRMVVIK